MIYPHLPYADAVHRALVDTGAVPDVVEARLVDDTGVLTARYIWPDRLRLAWSSVVGWRYETEAGGGILPVELAAAPAAVASLARTLLDGHTGPLPALPDQWERAGELEAALAEWEGEQWDA